MSDRTEPLLPAPAKEKEGLSLAKRKLLIGTLLCFLFMLAEIIGGLLAHSLAVMTDAAHMLSDVAGYVASAPGQPAQRPSPLLFNSLAVFRPIPSSVTHTCA